MALTVATRLTAGAVTIGEHACLQHLIDLVDGRGRLMPPSWPSSTTSAVCSEPSIPLITRTCSAAPPGHVSPAHPGTGAAEPANARQSPATS